MIGIYIIPLILIHHADSKQNIVSNNWRLKLHPAVMLQKCSITAGCNSNNQLLHTTFCLLQPTIFEHLIVAYNNLFMSSMLNQSQLYNIYTYSVLSTDCKVAYMWLKKSKKLLLFDQGCMYAHPECTWLSAWYLMKSLLSHNNQPNLTVSGYMMVILHLLSTNQLTNQPTKLTSIIIWQHDGNPSSTFNQQTNQNYRYHYLTMLW